RGPPCPGRRRERRFRLERRVRCTQAKRRILAEDRPLELLQLLAGLDPELVDEHGPPALVDRQRIRLAPAAVEREHELGTYVLAVGMCRDERLEGRDDIGVPAELELGIVKLRPDDELELLETGDLRLREQLEPEIGERWPTKERQSPTQDLDPLARILRNTR